MVDAVRGGYGRRTRPELCRSRQGAFEGTDGDVKGRATGVHEGAWHLGWS